MQPLGGCGFLPFMPPEAVLCQSSRVRAALTMSSDSLSNRSIWGFISVLELIGKSIESIGFLDIEAEEPNGCASVSSLVRNQLQRHWKSV